MNRLSILLPLIFAGVSCQAQRAINGKIAVELDMGVAKNTGGVNVIRDNYTAPSLTNNFPAGVMLGCSVTRTLGSLFVAGLALSKTDFSDWKDPASKKFDRARWTLLSATPLIGFRTPFRPRGILHVLTLTVQGGPSLTYNSVSLLLPVYSVTFVNSKTYNTGAACKFSADVALSARAFVGISVSAIYQKVHSTLFEDTSARMNSISLRLGLRLMNNKRFKYSDR